MKVFFHFFYFYLCLTPVQNQVKKDTPWLPKNTLLQIETSSKKKKTHNPSQAPTHQPNPVPSRINFFLKPVYFQRGENPGVELRRLQALSICGTQKGGSQKPHFREGPYSNFAWRVTHCKILWPNPLRYPSVRKITKWDLEIKGALL